MKPTVIHLPSGHRIETAGVNCVSGANIHFHRPDGIMFERLLAKDFRKSPRAAMLAFQRALAECLPDLGTDYPVLQVSDGLFIVGCKEGSSITLTRTNPEAWSDGEDTEGEILHYVEDEWEESPEEVLGGIPELPPANPPRAEITKKPEP